MSWMTSVSVCSEFHVLLFSCLSW